MILERYPDLQDLTSREKLILASELSEEFQNESDQDPEMVEALQALFEERMKHFRENPDTGISWRDLKKQRCS